MASASIASSSVLNKKAETEVSRQQSKIESGKQIIKTQSTDVSKRMPTQLELDNLMQQFKCLRKKQGVISKVNFLETMNFKDFKTCCNSVFRNKSLVEPLMQALFHRFKQFKIKEDSYDVSSEMDILDFLLGINCLSRIPEKQKVQIMFEICDQDDDGCMNPEDILSMLQKVERLFVRESQRIEIKSQILLNHMADKKAEQNFNMIMSIIRQQAIQKQFKEQLRQQRDEEMKANGGKHIRLREIKKKMQAHAPPVDLSLIPLDLITYREFMAAVNSDQIIETILPRSKNFMEVLQSQPEEITVQISDSLIDDFYMFRYELQLINNKNLFVDEQPTDAFLLGRNPLSKCQGIPVKDMIKKLNGEGRGGERGKEEQEILRKCAEIYQTPGIVLVNGTGNKRQPQVSDQIKSCQPSDTIYKRKKEDQRKDPSKVALAQAAQANMQKNPSKVVRTAKDLSKQTSLQSNDLTKQLQKDLPFVVVETEALLANEVDFQKLFDFELPPEALDLKDFVEGFKGKAQVGDGDSVELKEAKEFNRKARQKLEQVALLIPESDQKISAGLMFD